jgi:hypothetical protein
VAVLVAIGLPPGLSAHKPITSPYTFYEDVLPITQAKCGGCHAPDGIAPMSLLAHEAAVPWGESMRLELVAGHMPPGSITSPPGKFRDAGRLSARELNVLLTWATGGTPAGDPTRTVMPPSPPSGWTLGPPTEVLPLPRIALDAGEATRMVETVLPLGPRPRVLAAIDVRPGTRSIVRSARILVRESASTGAATERLIGLWVPGEQAVRLPDGSGWPVAPGAELIVRTTYRKRWDREREPAADESVIALYDVERPAANAFEIAATSPGSTNGRVVAVVPVARSMGLLALWPDTALAGSSVLVDVVQADGTRTALAAFDARAGWERRHWLTRTEPLPSGSRIEVTATWPSPARVAPAGARLVGFDAIAAD